MWNAAAARGSRFVEHLHEAHLHIYKTSNQFHLPVNHFKAINNYNFFFCSNISAQFINFNDLLFSSSKSSAYNCACFEARKAQKHARSWRFCESGKEWALFAWFSASLASISISQMNFCEMSNEDSNNNVNCHASSRDVFPTQYMTEHHSLSLLFDEIGKCCTRFSPRTAAVNWFSTSQCSRFGVDKFLVLSTPLCGRLQDLVMSSNWLS